MSVGRPRLLVVDDRAADRNLLCRRLERAGYEYTEAESGRGALDALRREAFDLVLLDVVMPDSNGFDVLRAIRANHSAATLPVIMVTAKAECEDIVSALGIGANDYITKPVNLRIAVARIEVQVARKRAEEELRRVNDELDRSLRELLAAHRDFTVRLANDEPHTITRPKLSALK